MRSPPCSASCATRATAGVCTARRSGSRSSTRSALVEDADGAAPEEQHGVLSRPDRACSGSAPPSCTAPSPATTDDPAFEPEPIKAADIDGWVERRRRKLANAAYAAADQGRCRTLPEAVRGAIDGLLERKDECLAAIEALGKGPLTGLQDPHPRRLSSRPGAGRQGRLLDHRLRGRAAAHPGGAPRQDARRSSDVAGMLRSFDYAAWAALDRASPSTRRIGRQAAAVASAWRDGDAGDVPRGLLRRHRRLPELPDGSRRGRPPARPLHAREGVLRDRLRGGQPPAWLRFRSPGCRRCWTA